MIKFFLSIINNGISFIAAVMAVFGLSISYFLQIWLGIGIVLIALILAIYWYWRIKPPTLSNPPSRRDLQDYFAHLETDFIEWTKRFVIEKQQQRWGKIPLYAEEMRFYTALSITELEESEEEEAHLRKGKIESLRQQLRDNQEYAMILTGQAGLGKTTSLRYLVYQDARDYQPGAPIPIYLELKKLSKQYKMRLLF